VLRGIWDRLTAGIVSFGEFWGTKEDVEERLAYNFNKAKTLSDFIGMIVRFAFANFAVAYFIKRSAEVRGFEGYVLGFCATMSAGLLLGFGASLVRVILVYEMQSVSAWKGTAARVIFIVLGLLSTACIWYGVMDLVWVMGSAMPGRPKG
jgi:hypothetical protein